MTERKTQRYSISVSSKTYDHLRSVITGSLAGFVDGIVASALDNPAMLNRLMARCASRKDTET